MDWQDYGGGSSIMSTPVVMKQVEPMSHHPTGEMHISVARPNPPVTELQVQTM